MTPDPDFPADRAPGATPPFADADDPAALNRCSYDAIAAQWDAARIALPEADARYLARFLDHLGKPARILDLGCGTGRPIGEHILRQGHLLTGVDQAAQLLALARARLPQGRWIEARIETFGFAEPCDGIVCWDALFHVHRSAHRTLFNRFAQALRPGGRLLLTVGGSEQSAFIDSMFGERFFYDSYPP
ncbi:MAG: hypothetical protein B7Z52_04820, partial [Burkholderiales bacterium 12-64-5]